LLANARIVAEARLRSAAFDGRIARLPDRRAKFGAVLRLDTKLARFASRDPRPSARRARVRSETERRTTMKYTLTLSRWHKVAERIQAALKEREAAAKAAFTATEISPWNRAGVEDKAAEIVRRAAADLALVEIGAQAVATIRAALALRNAALGVSTRLAEAEAANRRANLYKAIVDGQKPDMVRPADVQALPAGLIGETESWSFARRGAAAITLQTADKALLEALRDKLAREQARATRLLDEVADLNRERLEIEVPQEVAGIAGLAE
jgi:hypothetical protein